MVSAPLGTYWNIGTPVGPDGASIVFPHRASAFWTNVVFSSSPNRLMQTQVAHSEPQLDPLGIPDVVPLRAHWVAIGLLWGLLAPSLMRHLVSHLVAVTGGIQVIYRDLEGQGVRGDQRRSATGARRQR